MEEIYLLCEKVKEELAKIAEKGLNTSNLETTYKLIDIYKDIKNVEYWEAKKEYYDSQMDGGYSGEDRHDDGRGRDGYSARGRKRDSRGRYSRDGGRYARDGGYSYNQGGGAESYDRYLDTKQSYRYSGNNGECKKRLLEAADEHMAELTEQIEEMLRDADCAEEKETIKRYLAKLKSIS